MKFNQIFTKELYRQHQEWLQDDTTGKRLALHGADLRRADLRGANLPFRFLVIGPVGSRGGDTTYKFSSTIDEVQCGCRICALDEFRRAVAATYPEGQYRREYDMVIRCCEEMRDIA